MRKRDHTKPTRRDFIKTTAITAAGAIPARLAFAGPTGRRADPHPPDVIQVSSNHVVRGRRVHDALLRDMLRSALLQVTGVENTYDAWHSLLRADDVVGLKFNSSGAEGLGVSAPFAEAVISSLLEAGFEERQIVAIEAPEAVHSRYGIVRPVRGWNEKPTDFASGADQLAVVLDQVTAVINVPFLKTHNIAGMTCCLKNLSHGLIKHPARFHRAHCSPFIADIVALPQIRGKLRLNLVNALRVVFEGGPEARDCFTWDAGMVLAGCDPLAADTLGLQVLNSEREILGLPLVETASGPAVHLKAAASRGLGKGDPHLLEIRRIRL